MKNKKFFVLGVIVLILLVGFGCFFTSQLKGAYAIEDEIFDGFSGLYITEESPSVEIGGKVYVDLYLDRYMWDDMLHLDFKSTTSDDEFRVFLKNIDMGEPYFIVPETAIVGEKYELKSFVLYTNGDNGYGWGAGPGFVTNESDLNEYATYADLGNKKYISIVESEPKKEENEIKLNNFYLKDSASIDGERVYVGLEYEGDVTSIFIKLKHIETGQIYSRNITQNESGFNFMTDGVVKFIPGEYSIESLSLCSNQFGCSNYISVHNETYEWEKTFDFGENWQLMEKESQFKLVAINLNTYEAIPGETVYVDVNANRDIYSALLVFGEKNGNNSFSAYVKNLSLHPYFILPSIVSTGDYRLQSVVIQDYDGNSQVVTVPDFEGDKYTDENGVWFETLELTVKGNDVSNKDSLVFNNEDFNDSILKNISTLEETAVITVICDNSPNVSSELFKAIAESKKTLILKYRDSEWVFSGADIEEPKHIDVSMLISSVKDTDFGDSNIIDNISKEDISILSFAENGVLPGKTLIRLNSNELDSKFANNSLFVYYYDVDEDSLMEVALEVQKIEGYYEFYINHNSTYVLSKTKLSNKVVSDDDSLLKINNNYSKPNDDNNLDSILNIIIISVLIILFIVLICVFVKLKNKKKKNI